ncbi:DUF4019 domain-containing protein [Sphingomonas floccifaciens]|uniref:DUF4019 domain-containing protein n=1 Tax=Sphingomonas floccifaciens TaxID=1844115 RepID=A0ABW4NDE5_9SPHN
MSTQGGDAHWGLTEKEKETLRLIVRGHDAKSVARTLNLSVHTINERLRDARRKMAVASSREAARMLLAVEGGAAATPNSLGDAPFGGDPAANSGDPGGGPARRRSLLLIGVLLMTLILGLVALIAAPSLTQSPTTVPAATRSDVTDAAQQWLQLLDQGRWEDSYRVTGSEFRRLNTLKVWSDASNRVRKPLGAVMSRTLLSQENLPAPPSGYEVVKFHTRFANSGGEVTETVTLDRENGAWRVVGVTVG